MNAEVLNSWKEIAAYMGRGVRTVQRWEQELGLPVRRPRGKDRSAVIALKPDLDRWLRRTPQHALGSTSQRVVVHDNPAFDERRARLHLSTEKLIQRTHMLLARSQEMHSKVVATLAMTSKLRDNQLQRVEARRAAANGKLLAAKVTLLTTQVSAPGGGEPAARKP